MRFRRFDLKTFGFDFLKALSTLPKLNKLDGNWMTWFKKDKYKDLMVKIDEMAKQLKGLANYVKDLRKENLQLVKELAKQEKKKAKKQE